MNNKSLICKSYILLTILCLVIFMSFSFFIKDINNAQMNVSDNLIDAVVDDISLGDSHTLILTEDKKVYSFGDNSLGQLGINSRSKQILPTEIFDNDDFVNEDVQRIFAGANSSFLIGSNSCLYAFGDNSFGKLGINSDENFISLPQKITSTIDYKNCEDKVKEVSTSKGHTLILLENGKVLSVGENSKGQLGISNLNPTKIVGAISSSPSFINGDNTDLIIDIAVGTQHSVLLSEKGYVYGFGYNNFGELGLGTNLETALIPTKIENGNDGFLNDGYQTSSNKAVSITAGDAHTMILTASGNVYSTGKNSYGELGNNDIEYKNSYLPVSVVNENNHVFGQVKYIYAYNNTSTIVDLDGIAYTFGRNQNYGLGLNSYDTKFSSPQKVADGDGFLNNGSDKVEKILLGNKYGAIKTETGKIFTFGDGSYGQLGNGASTSTNTPSIISNTEDFQNINVKQVANGEEHSLIVDENGILYAAGSNSYGQLGIPGIDKANIPRKVSVAPGFANDGGDPVVYIFAGNYYSFFVLESGTIYSFGKNDYGQLGIGDCDTTNLPTRLVSVDGGFLNANNSDFISSKHSVISIAAAETHTLILTVDGTVFGFGNNRDNQVGIGNDLTSVCNGKSSLVLMPTRVHSNLEEDFINDGTQTEENKAIKVSVGEKHSIILNSSGKVYAFGDSFNGQMGTYPKFGSNKPILVSDNSRYSFVNGDETNKVIDIATGKNHTVVLVEDGTVYSFGVNENGSLGLGDISGYRDRARKIRNGDIFINGPIDNPDFDENEKAIRVFAYGNSTIILTANGQAFGFGENSSGKLGIGNDFNALIPTLIASTLDFDSKNISMLGDSISVGGNFTYLLSKDREVYSFGENNFGQLASDIFKEITYMPSRILTASTLFYPMISVEDEMDYLKNGENYINSSKATIKTLPGSIEISQLDYRINNGEWNRVYDGQIIIDGEGIYDLIIKSSTGITTSSTIILDKTAPVLNLNNNEYTDANEVFNEEVTISVEDLLESNFKVFYYNYELEVNEQNFTVGMMGQYKVIVSDLLGNTNQHTFKIESSKIKKYNKKIALGFNEDLEYIYIDGVRTNNLSMEVDSGRYEVTAVTKGGNFLNEIAMIDKYSPTITIDYDNLKTEYIAGEKSQNILDYIAIKDIDYNGVEHDITVINRYVNFGDFDTRKEGKYKIIISYTDEFWNNSNVEIEINVSKRIVNEEDEELLIDKILNLYIYLFENESKAPLYKLITSIVLIIVGIIILYNVYVIIKRKIKSPKNLNIKEIDIIKNINSKDYF